MDVVQFAAYVIIGTTAGRYLWRFLEDKNIRTEQIAVKAEYEDDRTSEKRKQLLLLRYPQYLVSSPGFQYSRIAHETVRADWGEKRTTIGRYFLGLLLALCLWVPVMAALWGGSLWFVTRLNSSGATSPLADLLSLFLALSLKYIWSVVILGGMLTHFTAVIFVVMRNKKS